MTGERKIVEEEDVRVSLQGPGKCGYCGQPVGEEHIFSCVCRTRAVVMEVTFQFVRHYPVSWDGETITERLNAGSSCMNNVIDSLVPSQGCTCHTATGKFLREATEQELNYFDGE